MFTSIQTDATTTLLHTMTHLFMHAWACEWAHTRTCHVYEPWCIRMHKLACNTDTYLYARVHTIVSRQAWDVHMKTLSLTTTNKCAPTHTLARKNKRVYTFEHSTHNYLRPYKWATYSTHAPRIPDARLSLPHCFWNVVAWLNSPPPIFLGLGREFHHISHKVGGREAICTSVLQFKKPSDVFSFSFLSQEE